MAAKAPRPVCDTCSVGYLTMTGYLAQDWTNFFIAAAGASAALAGLVIVAMSVNINQILKYRHLPPRAGATIATLILILVVSMAGLIPQSASEFGLEVLLLGAATCCLQVWSAGISMKVGAEFRRPWREAGLELVIGQVETLPFVIAGVLLVMARSSGVYWIAAGVIAIFIFSVLNAWVLLVEILR